MLLALPAGLFLAATEEPAGQESGSGGGVPVDETGVAAADEYRREIEPILRLRCFECHAGEEPESDLRLDELPWNFEDDAQRELWEAVYDELEAQRMPPFESTGLTRDERFFLLGRLYGALGRAGSDVHGVPSLRRLSVFEHAARRVGAAGR